jgi:outer membrane protein insertion porin family
MKMPYRLALLVWLLLAWLPAAPAQAAGLRVNSIVIRFLGPPPVTEAFVRANIRVKVGEPFTRVASDEDVKSLIATGYFFNIRVAADINAGGGVDVTYLVQGKPILTDIKIEGNEKMSLKKIKKKITSKIGQPLDERKLFDDAQAIKEMYEKAGYQKTTVKNEAPVVDEALGRGSVTIRIHETAKVKIKNIVFVNAKAATQKELRKVLKTRRRWFFSWLTGSGVLKEDQFEDDKDKLVEHYQNKGYIDFAIQDIRFDYINPKWMIVRISVSEGQPYKVGTLEIKGNHLFTSNDFILGKKINGQLMRLKQTPGAIFKPADFNDDAQTLRDMYGSRGYLTLEQGGTTVITPNRSANPATGTMDLSYDITEGEKCYIEKVVIKGNVKTKDRVLRRELAVYPGEVYDMVRVKISKQKLEGLDYFSKVDTEPEETDVPNHKDLVIGVEEKSTGNFTIGAGFSTVESIVGTVEVRQGDFDLFNPPTFTGAGQKLQLRVSVGTLLQDYDLNFIEPWFLGKRLSFGVDLFDRQVYYNALQNDYYEAFAGGTLSLKKALGSQFLTGTVSYTMEEAHVSIPSGYYPYPTTYEGVVTPPSVTTNILAERGSYFISKAGLSLSYNTLNNYRDPNGGQVTTISTETAAPPGDTEFYKLELRTSWFFKGFATNHIVEVDARSGVVSPWDGTSRVPIFERWFLGGMYSMRGFRYETVGPLDSLGEALGGDTYVYGSVDYSIPVVSIIRYHLFYDMGNVYAKSYSFDPAGRKVIDNDVGMGFIIVLPLGGGTPLQLDYGVPIMHDPTATRWGKFQFGFGYTHNF